jgi:D-alanyl-D-alanine carboxypeptidase/D-alanyl-D-alanine-endopeptidase (penicillin-binding protein 4)
MKLHFFGRTSLGYPRPAVLAFFVALSVASGAFSQAGRTEASQTKLTKRLAALVKEAAIGQSFGIVVADTQSGSILFAHNPELPLNPASNEKLLTAAAAMWELGPEFCMRTGIYGELQGNAIVGGAFLKGYGDPSLRSLDLVELAQQLAALGIKSVDEVVVDGSYFDNQVFPPAYNQHPDEISPFRAPIAAVAVERSTYLLTVRPGPAEGLPAAVQLAAAGYFELDNGLATVKKGPPEVIAGQRTKGDKLYLSLRGRVPLGIREINYRRSVEDPLLYSGYAMVDALRSQRIQVPLRVQLGKVPTSKPLLASKRSAPLAELVAAMGKNSDNFVAEMIFKVLGAERKRQPGRSSDGALVVLETLKRKGIPIDKVTVVNGSGLYNGNLVTVSAIAKLLLAVYRDPAIRTEYLAHLAVGGSDGTLSRRLGDLPASRIVRAKTGTLSDAVALSGYVLGPGPNQTVAFSLIANHVGGNLGAAKKLADDLVRAIVGFLWG